MAINSLKSGAFEFIQKPFDKDRLLNFINRAVENFNLKNENKKLHSKLFHSFDLIGKSQNILRINEQIQKLSLSDSRSIYYWTNRFWQRVNRKKIHKKSNRKNSPFIILNGALLDLKKYETELFGEEKRWFHIIWFTRKSIRWSMLLIDEVTEIPLATQSKILRVVIDQKFRRLNGNHDIKVDVRIICSTSKDIKNEIKDGNFREDLFHRLNVFNINIEPLNKRVEDIPLLIEYFSKKM